MNGTPPVKESSNAHFLAAAKAVDREGLAWHDPRKAPFSLHGVICQEDGAFRRMPWEIAHRVSPKVYTLHSHTSGGRVRFVTDSDRIAVDVAIPCVELRTQMSLEGSLGFDVYVEENGKEKYCDSLQPPIDTTTHFCSGARLPGGRVTVTLYFPLYNDVTDLKIGLDEGSLVEPAPEYTVTKPILFYGSSITQGCAASRPGLAYVAQLARKLGADYINLGFSGACKGEKAMADYLATIPSSVFVLDYDHNAPNLEHLAKTHWPVYRAYREKNPNTPIVFVTRPTCTPESEKTIVRRDLILSNYLKAKSEGDENVYFVDGFELMDGEDRFDCVVDGIHPNDLGMNRMAKIIGKTVRLALEKHKRDFPLELE